LTLDMRFFRSNAAQLPYARGLVHLRGGSRKE
jgi:hypothetical protein